MRRLVLDTNVLVSALLFTNGRLAPIRHAWRTGRIVPVLCKATADELLRVLSYPKFELSAGERDELLSDLLPHIESHRLKASRARLPVARDPADQVFLQLARSAKVDALVTGDKDLLASAAGFEPPIVTPATLLAELANPPAA